MGGDAGFQLDKSLELPGGFVELARAGQTEPERTQDFRVPRICLQRGLKVPDRGWIVARLHGLSGQSQCRILRGLQREPCQRNDSAH